MAVKKKTAAAAEASEDVVEIKVEKEVEPEELDMKLTYDEPQKKSVMYVGPTIPTVGIQNRVYTEIPDGAKDAIAKVPEIGNLFVQIAAYPEANRMLREKQGYIYSAYNKALKLKGGNKS